MGTGPLKRLSCLRTKTETAWVNISLHLRQSMVPFPGPIAGGDAKWSPASAFSAVCLSECEKALGQREKQSDRVDFKLHHQQYLLENIWLRIPC